MGHGSEVYISNLVMKLRGNRRFWGLDKKILAASFALRLPLREVRLVSPAQQRGGNREAGAY